MVQIAAKKLLKFLKSKTRQLRISTLNISTLTGHSYKLAKMIQCRRIDIACIHGWKGQKSKNIGSGYKLIYHGTSNSNVVAIIVNEGLRSHVAEVHRHSDCLTSGIIDTPARCDHVFCAYTPQTGLDEYVKDKFYNEHQAKISTCPAEDLLLLCGDLNGHLSSSKNGHQCHGNQGYELRNDDGHRILDFAEANDLVICDTFFKKRTTLLITYISGNSSSQIDSILLRRHDLTRLTPKKFHQMSSPHSASYLLLI